MKPDEIETVVTEMKELSEAAVVARLVDNGVSRLSAERIVEIERGSAEPGRARTHTMSRH